MTEREFCYWLQGVMEVSNPETLGPEQIQVIKDHLKLVFTKATPIVNIPQLQAMPRIYDNGIKGYRDLVQGLQGAALPNAVAHC
jgi:hypothetical protein